MSASENQGLKQAESTQELNRTLAKNIELAIELETLFKLYSYRIIGPDQFNERTNEAVNRRSKK